MRIKPLILILLALGLFYTFTRPQYRQAKELRATAAEYSEIIDNVEKIAETRDRLLVDYEKIPPVELDRLTKVLPDNVDSVRLALDLETIASAHGISISDVKVETDVDRGVSLPQLPEYALPYGKVAVSFSFVSNYGNFTSFLSDLEKSLRVMDVKRASFRVSETGFYEHGITVETYWLTETPAALSRALGADLLQLSNGLSKVTLNQELFSSLSYRNLSDWSTALPEAPVGRANPFERLGVD